MKRVVGSGTVYSYVTVRIPPFVAFTNADTPFEDERPSVAPRLVEVKVRSLEDMKFESAPKFTKPLLPV